MLATECTVTMCFLASDCMVTAQFRIRMRSYQHQYQYQCRKTSLKADREAWRGRGILGFTSMQFCGKVFAPMTLRLLYDFMLVSLRIFISFRLHIDSNSSSFRSHRSYFVCTLASCRLYFGLTSASLRTHICLTSVSHRFHLGLWPLLKHPQNKRKANAIGTTGHLGPEGPRGSLERAP